MSEGGMDESWAPARWVKGCDWNWYVVATMPGSEDLACRTIGRLGIETYVPKVLVQAKHGRVIRKVERPAFRSYVFATFSLDDPRWPDIARCFGVSRILTLADSGRFGIPAPLPAGLVEAMKAAGTIVVQKPKGPRFQKGEEVRVVDGPFAGFLAKIAKLDSRGRCVLLLRIFGRETSARLELAQIAKR
jgi:transcriptional antiterminator RfaH